VVIPVVVAVLAVAGVVTAVAVQSPAPTGVRTVRIPVVDGPANNQRVVLDATFFTPAGNGRAPAILLAHGFGETKDAVEPEAENLARAGFAVLTWSARGFGASTGQIGLDSPSYEVKDTEQLVSWLARQPSVLLDHPGDPRVGITGTSYGGGISLLASAYDHRIDAVVAQSTWNNLATALFPNGAVGGDAAGGGEAAAGGAGSSGAPAFGGAAGGVFKKQWAGLLFTQGAAGFGAAGSGAGPGSGGQGAGQGSGSSGQGSAGAGSGSAGDAGGAAGIGAARQSARCGRFLPSVCRLYQQIATTGQPNPQALSLLWASSPASVASRMDAPTLLIQGEHDSLFGLDQADANYQALHRTGAPVNMVWFSGGHDGGNQQPAHVDALTADWFKRWLGPGSAHGGGSAAASDAGQPGFQVTRVLGFDPNTGDATFGIAAASSYPGLSGTSRSLVRLTGPPQTIVNPPGGAPASISVFPGLGSLGAGGAAGGLAFDMPGQSAAFTSPPLRSALQVTGSPMARVRVQGPGTVTLFAGIYDVDQGGSATLPYQLVAPLRVTGATGGRVVTVRLPAMDYSFSAGHRLRLVLTTTDFAYATPAAPSVYRVALAGTGLTLPADQALTLVTGGVPAWVWIAPPVALLAAAVILLLGWRRHREDRLPALAEVPLEVTGLTKRFGDGQLAVDGLSLRVERGQILGLLGPNGAGKTTTLRASMGLVHPDAGTITIFGRRVHAGSTALSRLGSFVEGPGFLPHLSGRANLDLYWRSTGRPEGDAHMAEVLAIAGLGPAVDRRVRAYSRGMSQRLAIAQAMLGLPDLLVLDEPMNGLDPPQIREMRDVLLGYAAAGRTVILSSHLLGEVEQTCTHVVVMSHGRRVAAGPVAAIMADGGTLLVGTPQAQRAAGVLRGLPGIKQADARQDGVLVHPNGVPASDVVAALVGAGIPVDRVGPGQRLEDAFLALIGGAAADGENPQTGGAAAAGEPAAGTDRP
jgi:ABC-2 type transport system ATP-binding protein